MDIFQKMFADGVPVNEMPLKCSRPEVQPVPDSRSKTEYDPAKIRIIKTAAEKLGLSTSGLFFTAISMVIGKYAVSEDLVIGIEKDGVKAPVRVRPVRSMTVKEFAWETGTALREIQSAKEIPSDIKTDVLVRIAGGTSADTDSEAADCDLVFDIIEDGDDTRLMLGYSAELFEDALIRDLMEQLEFSINAICDNSMQTVREATALPPSQLDRLMSFSTTAKGEPAETLLHVFFEKKAAEQPEKTALVATDRTLSYRELDEGSNIVANELIRRGVRARDSIVLLLPRRSFYFEALFGVLKAGAAFIPCDPKYPQDRINSIISDSDAKFIISTKDRFSEYPEQNMLDINELLTGKDVSAPDVKISPDDLAYMIYTSGSTGKPKGVMLTHRGICNYCTCHPSNVMYDLIVREVNAMIALSTVSFDLSMKDTIGVFCSGKTVVFADEEEMNDPEKLTKLINENGVDGINCTPSRYMQYLEYEPFAEALSRCRVVIGGAEPYPMQLLKRLSGLGIKHLLNTYGPTEITISSNLAVLNGADHITIGRPLYNYFEYIVDRFGDMVPRGVPGELYIGGPGVARGYRGLPEKTAEVFVEYKGQRMYRSGDLAKWEEDGKVFIFGRLDGQIKLRGLRIETGEIESVIGSFEGIKEVVTAVKKIGGAEHLAAYYTADRKIDTNKLKEYAASKLAHYMVPTAYTQLDAMPISPNGKTDRNALPEPVIIKTDKKTQGAAPLNVLEKELKEIVSGIVGTDEFGITDCFGDLGITSLTSISLALKVYKKYNVQLDAMKLVPGGTIQSVENEILEKLLSGNTESTGAKEKRKTSGACRLSFAQQGVYTECQANPESIMYNLPHVLRFPDGISAGQLEEAVRRVVSAHPGIVCRFVSDENDEIVQEPIPDFRLDIPVREMSAGEFEEYKYKFIRPFDLANGPTVRFEIIKADGLILLSDMHHLVSDGSSMDMFYDQLVSVIDGEEIEDETYSYADYVAEEEITDEAEKFFEKQLSEAEEPTQLIPDVYEKDLPHAEKSVSVKTDIADAVSFARSCGVTPAAVYLAAACLTYARYVCEDTAAIVTISNGRSNLKIGNTMGMFVNTLPFVASIDNKETVKDYLHRIAEKYSDTIEHESYPFTRIAGKYDFHPSTSYTWQIGIQNRHITKYGAITVENFDADIAKFPVGVYIEGTETDAVIRVIYDSSMYSEEMMRLLAESVENVLHGLMTCQTLSQISLTSEKQWEILDSFNPAIDMNYNTGDSVAAAFRRTAAKNPDKEAAVFRDKSYTYRELDELTDKLAAKIYKYVCEVTGKTELAEEVAAILLPRDENVFIMPLAVIKAGLAYEPLDPSYPKERLNFMVKDAGVRLLIADEKLTGLVDEYNGPVITVKELYEMEDAPKVQNEPSPKDLFIMLYTSGSTGAPKGCQIEHGNLVAYAHGLENVFCTGNDRTGAYASFGFDVNMEDIFCTLINGGTVCLIPDEVRMDLGKLADYFDEAGVTALLLTTQVGVQFIRNYPKLKTLRLLVMGGEKLPAVDPSSLSYSIANGYGPTENCCGVSTFTIRRWEPNIPIGKPFPTINAFVLDRTGHRLPAGAAGEYCLSGPQVTRGYLNRPDKTAEAYEKCPFNEFHMYHTGDIVRYRTSGDVEFVGRKDGQVKIRGFRVETKEVEAVIRSFEGISDVTVQAYDFPDGGKYLAAFVVSGDTVDTDKLTAFIKGQKPAYMVPSVIMQIDSVPLTVNQKVDKKALPVPVHKKAEYVAPAGKTEEDMCKIFAGVLGIDRISAEGDFFDLGGSSILAMKVVIAAGKAGYNIVYNDVFSYTTPKALAAYADGGEKAEDVKAVPETQTQDKGKDVPETGRDGYDYAKIHSLLSKNTLEAFTDGERLPLGDVLLLGGTGYLGSHVLHRLITDHDNRIYCLIRPGSNESGEKRLKKTLRAYFGNEYAGLFGVRIIVIEGDATNAESLMEFTAPCENMTAINCAASVKHFAKGGEIDRINVGSVKNLTVWCRKNNARLVHISTASVMGKRENGMPPKDYRFTEKRLFAGQNIDNSQYIHSKFMAERHIYEEVMDNGLRAKVIRVGNLAPRDSDGQFQINYTTNSFMNTLRAYETLGVIGFDELDDQVEFSPIDAIAEAVLLLAGTPDDCICFMPLNPHRPVLGDIIHQLENMGYKISGAEASKVKQALNEALLDEAKSEAVSSLIAYNNNSDLEEVGLENCDITYSTRILRRLGYSWPETGAGYIRRFLEVLEEKDFFRGKA